jgi:ferredoxin
VSADRTDIAPRGKRFKVQLWALLGMNSYVLSYPGKYLCLPVLNCYACPVGVVSCPVGSITAFALVRQVPYYIIGFLGLIALSVGRGLCGWACPFGLLQDVLYRVPSRKWRLPQAANGLKYALLVVLVIGLPALLGSGAESSGTERIVAEAAGALDYCALVCPVGTLEAGIPGLLVNADLREHASWRTAGKFAILGIVLALVVVSRRGFCRTLCPIGAMMAVGSRLSLLQMRTDRDRCTHCMRCVRVCPTASRLVPSESDQREASAECVLCLDCVRTCPEPEVLSAAFAGRVVSASQGKAHV